MVVKFVGKMEESKMTHDLFTTCKKGPLRELKEKINSSNINSRNEV